MDQAPVGVEWELIIEFPGEEEEKLLFQRRSDLAMEDCRNLREGRKRNLNVESGPKILSPKYSGSSLCARNQC